MLACLTAVVLVGGAAYLLLRNSFLTTNDTEYYDIVASGSETSGPEYTRADDPSFESPESGAPWNTSDVLSMSPISENVFSGAPTLENQTYENQILIVDVGQGSCAIIRSGGTTAVFDTGDTAHAQVPVAVLKKLGISNIAYLINSHWDNDHCGATIGIFKNFTVENFLYADYEADTRTYQSIKSYITDHEMHCIIPKPGDTFKIGSLTMTITGPLHYSYEEENSNSISAIISDGQSSVFIGGDTTLESELDILSAGIGVDCDVYLVNHHGSTTSSSDAFLQALSPEYSIVSCGKDNDYGHPARSVLNRIKASGSELFRTDLQGDIEIYFTDDGIQFSEDPTDDWTPGVYHIPEDQEIYTPESVR